MFEILVLDGRNCSFPKCRFFSISIISVIVQVINNTIGVVDFRGFAIRAETTDDVGVGRFSNVPDPV